MSRNLRRLNHLLSLLIVLVFVFEPVSVAVAAAQQPVVAAAATSPEEAPQVTVAAPYVTFLPLLAVSYAPPVTAPITPGSGGSLQVPGTGFAAIFQAGAITETATASYQPLAEVTPPTGKALVGQPFALTLTSESGQPITRLLPEVSVQVIDGIEKYTVTPRAALELAYNDAALAGLDESRLRLHYLDQHGNWVPMLTLLDTQANQARVPTDHLTEFALFAPTQALTDTVTVVLDPDHGGADPGGTVRSPVSYAIEEKVVNLDTAMLVRDYLQACGVQVEMTREDDSSMSEIDRANFINGNDPDLAVTIGTNISTDTMRNFTGGPMGLADFAKPDDVALAQLFVETISNTTTLPPTRGVRDAATWRGGLYVPTHVPDVLYAQIETAFLDSYPDRDNIIDPRLDTIAGGIYNGIIQQLNQTQCPPFDENFVDKRLQRTNGINAWTRYTAQGVNPVTGNQFTWSRDLFVPGPGLNMDFTRYYNNTLDFRGLFGRHWSSLWDMHLDFLADGVLRLQYADGHLGEFTPNGGGYQPEAGIFDTLQAEGGGYHVITPDRLHFRFDSAGVLQTIQDDLGNTITLHYAGSALDWIEDAAGQRFEVDTDVAGQITRIADPGGREVTYTYGTVSLERTEYLTSLRGPLSAHSADQLLQMTNANGGNTGYEYDPGNGYLSRVSDPQGISYLENVYTPDGRVAQQKNGNKDQGTWDYQLEQMRAIFTDNEGHTTTYLFDSKYRVSEEIDALGQSTKYEYDDHDNITAMTDKRGNTWRYTYDERGNMLTRTDPRDQWSLYPSDVTTWVYNAQNKPTQMTDALGFTWKYEYDDKGNPVKITEPNGAITEAQYDGKGQLTWLKDAEGRITRFEYDDKGNRIQTHLPGGGWTKSTYDGSGHQLTFTECLNPPGCSETRTTKFEYDGNGNLKKMTDPMGKDTLYEYDGNNMLVKQTDRRGGVSETKYDDNLNPTWQKDPLGRIQEFTYDKMNHRLTAKDPLGRVTQFQYDEIYRMVKVIQPAPFLYEYHYAYDANGNLLTLTDPAGNQTRFVYDVTNRRKFVHDAIGGTTEYCYDPLDHITRVFDPRRAVTTISYDSVGNMSEVADPLANRTTFGYDRVHNRTRLTVGIPSDGVESDGSTTRFEYDGQNRQVKITDPLNRVTQMSYDGVGNLRFVTDPLGRTTETRYNLNGWAITQIDPLGGTSTSQYDDEGALRFFTDANTHTAEYRYDAVGQLRFVVDPLGQTTEYRYDLAGNQTHVVDALGRMSESVYNELNLLTDEYDPLRNHTGYTYDKLRRLTARTDANGKTTHYAYNPLGWLTSVTDAIEGTTEYGYDIVGNRTVITDTNGIATHFEFNVLNQLKHEINPIGDVWEYSYDARGNLIRRVDGMWQATYYEYDKADQLTATRYGVGSGGQSAVTFEYDANGNEIAMHDGNGDWTYLYDALNRRTSATDAKGRTLQWEYDPVGNRTAMIYPDGRRVELAYDATDQLQTLTDAQSRQISWAYDPLGFITNQSNPNNTQTAYTYDDAGRLTNLTNQGAGGVTLAAYTYTLDAVGNRTRTVEQRDSKTITRDYAYDDLYRLTAARTDSGEDMQYVYDPVGNRTRKHGTPEPVGQPAAPEDTVYTYNELNSMLTAGVTDFAYDENGNRIRKSEPITATQYVTATLAQGWDITGTVVTTYTWDYENRLTGVATAIHHTQTATYTQVISDAGGITTTVGITVTAGISTTLHAGYTYDGYGRRIAKWVTTLIDETGVLPGPEFLRREYVFDGLDPVVEYESDRPQPAPFTITAHYTYANGRMALLERTDPTETKSYWFHYDGLGSVISLTDETGLEACKYQFDEYGVPLKTCAAVNRYSYTGQELDEETGLYHFFARYYDAEAGVWVSQDGYRGIQDSPDSLHRYLYVSDNPITIVDKYGYCPWCVVIIAAIVIITIVDYVWTAYDIHQDIQVIEDENSTEIEKEVARLDMQMAVTFEILEPDEEEPINPGTIPADDIARKIAMKQTREKLMKEAMENGILKLTRNEMEETLIKQGFKKGSKELAEEISERMAKQSVEKALKDPNKVAHIVENIGHDWAKAGVKNSDDAFKLIQEVISENYDNLPSGQATEFSKVFSDGYEVVVRGIKMPDGSFEIGTAFVR